MTKTLLFLQGRIPDAERGGVGHLQPHHLRQQGAGRLPRTAGRHRTLLQVSPRYSSAPVILIVTSDFAVGEEHL